MTDRETFERVREHLLSQGRRSADACGCRYRTMDSPGPPLRCAVGCLIPDDRYSPQFEGKTVRFHPIMEALGEAWVLPRQDWRRIMSGFSSLSDGFRASLRLLSVLQQVHDRAAVSRWAELLERLAAPELWSPQGGYLGTDDPHGQFPDWQECARKGNYDE